jgi:hypothetical protein
MSIKFPPYGFGKSAREIEKISIPAAASIPCSSQTQIEKVRNPR